MSKIIVGLTLLLGLLSGYLASFSQGPVLGSTVQGNDYSATSTRSSAGVALSSPFTLKASGGSVARVTITGANTGIIRLWNATTTDATKRATSLASSTLTVIEIPASAVANTYDFDADFGTGIVYEVVSGLAPTSTISWR